MLKDNLSTGSSLIRNILLARAQLACSNSESSASLESKISNQVAQLANWLTQAIRVRASTNIFIKEKDDVSRWIGQALANRVVTFKQYQGLRKEKDHESRTPLSYLIRQIKRLAVSLNIISAASPNEETKPLVEVYMIDPVFEAAVYGYGTSSRLDPERVLASEMVVLLALNELLNSNIELDYDAELRLLSILAKSFAESRYYCQEQLPLLLELVNEEELSGRLEDLLLEKLDSVHDDDFTADCRSYIDLLSLIASREVVERQQSRLEAISMYGLDERAHLVPLSLMHVAKNIKAHLSMDQVKQILAIATEKYQEAKQREKELGVGFDGDLERLIDALSSLQEELTKDLKVIN